MQFLNLLLTAIVAGSTMVSAGPGQFGPTEFTKVVPRGSARAFGQVNSLHGLKSRHGGALAAFNAAAENERRAASSKRCKAKKTSSKSKASAGKSKGAAPKKAATPQKTTAATTTTANNPNAYKGLPVALADGKLGLCYGDPGLDLTKWTTGGSKVGWAYNWRAAPWSNEVPAGVSFIPMLWGTKNNAAGDGWERLQEWKEKIMSNPTASNPLLKGGVIAAFNEADLSTQGDMSVGDACDVMRQYMVPLKQSAGVKLIGPSSIMGQDWYKQFRSQCRDVFDAIDYDSVHDYNIEAATTISRFQDWYKEFGKPMWISEIGCYNYNTAYVQGDCSNPATAIAYISGVTKWAMGDSSVVGISPYGIFQNTNIGWSNSLVTGSDPSTLWRSFIAASV